ncbi:MAG: ankyrin repeat domain-containing protein [Phycisphaerae bacterium]
MVYKIQYEEYSLWQWSFAVVCCCGLLALLCGCQRDDASSPKTNTTTTLPVQTKEFIRAAVEGDASTMARLLHDGMSANRRDEFGKPVLNLAAQFGKAEVVVLLLDHGADVNAVSADGDTALNNAVGFNKPNVVSLLLDRGADVNAGKPWSPLAHAASQGNLEICRILLAHHADPNGSKPADRPLYLAAQQGHADVVEALIDARAQMEVQNSPGNTALMIASENRKWKCARVLVEKGANVNIADAQIQNRTPLHFAAADNNMEMVQLLLSHGALRDTMDKLGNTPYDFARRARGSDQKILDLLANSAYQNK